MYPTTKTLNTSELVSSKTSGTQISKMAALGTPGRDVSVDASLGVCALPVVEEIGVENRSKGCAVHCNYVIIRETFRFRTYAAM